MLRTLLDTRAIIETVVPGDALYCQRGTAEALAKAGDQYILAVKVKLPSCTRD